MLYFKSTFCVTLFVISASAWPTTPPKSSSSSCTAGESFVRNNILYDCINESGKTHAKPIGCAPEGDKEKTIVKAGEVFTNEHFKYQCDEEKDGLVLKVINCIDSTGTVVDIGSFFTTEDENGNHQTTECLGDYFKAKKTVLQWTKCTLPSGIKVTEGNFHVQTLSSSSKTSSSTNKPPLQKGEILSCIRNGKEVGLKCTGCVSEHTSVHVGVSGYVEVKGQWTQCRRTKDGCRLINVTRNYVDCQLQGSTATYQNGVYFNDTNGVSTYYCNHGVVSKQGCTIDGQWALVGEVVYNSNGEAFLCDSSSTYSSFNGLKGCVLPDGSVKKFQDVWRDEDVMKRCYWKNGPHGPVEDVIVSYACIRGEETFPENKIIQRDNGVYEKCVRGFDGELGIRKLNEKELKDFIKRKTLRLDLNEYYANGGKGNIETFSDSPLADSETITAAEKSKSTTAADSTTSSTTSSSTPSSTTSATKSEQKTSEPTFPPMDDSMKESLTVAEAKPEIINNQNTPTSTSASNESCVDLVPFCSQISSYCPDFDRYQMIDGETGTGKDSISSAIIELQDLVSGNLGKDKDGHRAISPCEAHFLTHQRKMKLLVDIICPKTCNSCLKPDHAEKVLSKLQGSSKCG